MNEVDILFVGAHADDIELSCGGSVAKFAAGGLRVGIVDLTRGEMGTRGTPETRRREAAKSSKILGAAFRDNLDLGDGALRTGREEELEVIDVVRRTRPKIVFTPYPDDRHPDHTRTGQLVTEAAFYAGLKQLRTKFTAHRPQTVIYFLQNYMVPPSFVIDVSDEWKTKMRAINAFRSQFFNPKSKEPQTFISKSGFLEMIDARGRHFGALIGVPFGEAFVTKQPPRIDDVIAAYGGREV